MVLAAVEEEEGEVPTGGGVEPDATGADVCVAGVVADADADVAASSGTIDGADNAGVATYRQKLTQDRSR